MNINDSKFLKNSRQIRYITFFVTIFFISLTVNLYVNNVRQTNINIEDRISERERIKEERQFLENFEMPYLKSDYSRIFIAHESNIIRDNQYRIVLEDMDYDTTEQEEEEGIDMVRRWEEITSLNNPQEAWHHFFRVKFDNINL